MAHEHLTVVGPDVLVALVFTSVHLKGGGGGTLGDNLHRLASERRKHGRNRFKTFGCRSKRELGGQAGLIGDCWRGFYRWSGGDRG